MRIRDAAVGDAVLLAEWASAMAWETEHKRLDAETVLAGVRAGIADPSRARYLVAMQDAPVAGNEVVSVPVGTLMLTREWSDWRNGDWWWIQSVYVAPAHRRAGVYRALYRHVEAQARATPGVIGLRLYVERENENAQRTYRALGMDDAGYRIFEAGF
nr:GNAT family N-acetyltransferase [Lysobacter penaei]